MSFVNKYLTVGFINYEKPFRTCEDWRLICLAEVRGGAQYARVGEIHHSVEFFQIVLLNLFSI